MKKLFLLIAALCCEPAIAMPPKTHWEVRYYRAEDSNYLTEDDFRDCVYGRIDAVNRANELRNEHGIHAVQVFRCIRVTHEGGYTIPTKWVDVEYDIDPVRVRRY